MKSVGFGVGVTFGGGIVGWLFVAIQVFGWFGLSK